MRTPIFLSVARPRFAQQAQFLARMTAALEAQGMRVHTVGVTEKCDGSPLPAIRRLMTEVEGLVVVAFRRTWIADRESWFTSVFCHLEAAMAYQCGLPILIARERGVTVEGMLEAIPGCCHLPEFDLDQHADPLRAFPEWDSLLAEWGARVRPASQTLSTSGGG